MTTNERYLGLPYCARNLDKLKLLEVEHLKAIYKKNDRLEEKLNRQKLEFSKFERSQMRKIDHEKSSVLKPDFKFYLFWMIIWISIPCAVGRPRSVYIDNHDDAGSMMSPES